MEHLFFSLIQKPVFWVDVGFLLVIIMIALKFRGAILGGAYAKIERITKSIAYSEELREKAQHLLVEYEKESRIANEKSERVLEVGRHEAAKIVDHWTEHTKLSVDIIKARAKATIMRAEADARKLVHDAILDKAMSVATIVIENDTSKNNSKGAFNDAINAISLLK